VDLETRRTTVKGMWEMCVERRIENHTRSGLNENGTITDDFEFYGMKFSAVSYENDLLFVSIDYNKKDSDDVYLLVYQSMSSVFPATQPENIQK